ncbi:MAG: hypothetical protein QXW47_11685 [Candidatus Jordarchaeales archaeon]
MKQTHSCSVEGCGNPAARSFSQEEIAKIMPKVGLSLQSSGKKIYLCEKHYKQVKKELKKQKKLEKIRHGLPF